MILLSYLLFRNNRIAVEKEIFSQSTEGFVACIFFNLDQRKNASGDPDSQGMISKTYVVFALFPLSLSWITASNSYLPGGRSPRLREF